MTSAAMFQPVDTHDSFDDQDMGHASCGLDSAIEREAADHDGGGGENVTRFDYLTWSQYGSL